MQQKSNNGNAHVVRNMLYLRGQKLAGKLSMLRGVTVENKAESLVLFGSIEEYVGIRKQISAFIASDRLTQELEGKMRKLKRDIDDLS